MNWWGGGLFFKKKKKKQNRTNIIHGNFDVGRLNYVHTYLDSFINPAQKKKERKS
jgi:hypothetical protein